MKKPSEKPSSFLSREELDGRVGHSDIGYYGKAHHWSVAARDNETLPRWDDKNDKVGYKPLYHYLAVRTEGEGSADNLVRTHKVSFLNEIIPAILERKKREGRKEKCKVLDIGGGAGLFAKQIRDKYGDSVEVFTTGLKKSTARAEIERTTGAKSKLHKNDLKWRSVRQLSDYEEFDLIVDTFGEFLYGSKFETDRKGYVLAVIRKLKPGGMASLLPPDLWPSQKNILFDFLSSIEKTEKFTFEEESNGVLRIYKNDKK